MKGTFGHCCALGLIRVGSIHLEAISILLSKQQGLDSRERPNVFKGYATSRLLQGSSWETELQIGKCLLQLSVPI